MSIGKRIENIRNQHGLSQSKFGKIIGASGSAVGLWEREERIPKAKHMRAIAEEFGVNIVRLQFGETEQQTYDHHVPVVGKVAAGGHIHPVDDHAQGGGLDLVPAPPGTGAGTVAARVDGNSFYPVLKNGALIFWSKRREDIDNYINEMVVCHLIDGRKMVKIITRGGQEGTYTLISTNAPPMENLQVESVSPIDWMKP